MLKPIQLLIALSFSYVAYGQTVPAPENYRVIESVSGDLDKDSIKELVVTYTIGKETTDYESLPRELIVYKMKGNVWIVWKRSKQALYGSRDGGMMGDPYGGVEIKNGVLEVSQNGGSSWKWGHTDKYRYQDNDFYLIGYSSDYGKICEEWTSVDFNLSTGKVIVEKEYQTCDDTDEQQKVYKTETETMYKKGLKITLEKRNQEEIKLVTANYRHEIYISDGNE